NSQNNNPISKNFIIQGHELKPNRYDVNGIDNDLCWCYEIKATTGMFRSLYWTANKGVVLP
ncbi:TPA: hypothetical protein ACO6V9_005817, partial [Klebsiella pneumoniae]